MTKTKTETSFIQARQQEFVKLVTYFPFPQLPVRMVHDHLSYKQCQDNWKRSNAINYYLDTKNIPENLGELRLSKTYKNATTIDQHPDWVDTWNGRGYAFFILPNGAHRQEDLTDIHVYFWDKDLGKYQEEFHSLEEAEKRKKELTNAKDVEGKVKIVQRTASKWSIIAKRKETYIKKDKKAFREKHQELIKNCLISESPNGYRGIYFLTQPIKLGKDKQKQIDRFKLINEAIAVSLDCDRNLKNPVHALRFGPFYHSKDPFKKEYVQTINFPKGNFTYTEEELFKLLDLEKSITLIKEEEKEKRKAKKERKTEEKEEIKPLKNVEDGENFIFEFKKPQLEEDEKIPEKMPMIDFVAFVKNRPMYELIDEMEDRKILCGLPNHHDTKASGTLTETESGYLYGCFGCNSSMDIIEIYRTIHECSFDEAVRGLAKLYDVQIVRSEFITLQLEKYQQNVDWFVEMFNNKLLEKKMPITYEKFFKRTSMRQMILEKILQYAQANLREIKHEGDAVFWMQYSKIEQLINDMLRPFNKKEKSVQRNQVVQAVKMFELLGMIKEVPLEKMPKSIQKKAREVAEGIKTKHKVQFDIKTINFYVMTNWKELGFKIEERAKNMKENGMKNKTHTTRLGVLAYEGKEKADEMFLQNTQEIPKWMKTIEDHIEKILLEHIGEEREGYSTKKRILEDKKRIRISRPVVKETKTIINNYNKKMEIEIYEKDEKGKVKTERRSPKKEEKEKVIDLVFEGENGVLRRNHLEKVKASSKLCEQFGIDYKDVRNQWLIVDEQKAKNYKDEKEKGE